MTEKKKGLHRGWLMLIFACIISSTFWQIIGGLSSLFALPVSSALGVNRSTFMLWMTVYAITYAIGAPLWGNWLQNNKIKFKALMLFGCACAWICLLLFAFGTNVWFYWIGGAIVGFGVVGMLSIGRASIVNMWFTGKRRGTALGIASAFQGVGGFVWAPIVQLVIGGFGYQAGYLFCLAVHVVLHLPCILLFVVRRPEDIGLKPIGYDPNMPPEEAIKQDSQTGMTNKQSMKTTAFWALFLTVCVLSFMGGYKNNSNGIAVEFLTGQAVDAAMIGAWMISAYSVADLVSNLVMGYMIDKAGVRVTSVVFIVLTMLAFVFYLALGTTVAGLLAGAVCLGCHVGIIRNCVPMLTRELYGSKDFSKNFGIITMGNGFLGGLSSAVIALFYDISASYVTAIYGGIFIVLVAGICIVFATTRIGKYKWPENTAAA